MRARNPIRDSVRDPVTTGDSRLGWTAGSSAGCARAAPAGPRLVVLAREYHRWREPMVSSTVPCNLPICLQVTSAEYTKSYSAPLISLFL